VPRLVARLPNAARVPLLPAPYSARLCQRLPESIQFIPKLFSDFLRFAPQFLREYKIVGELLGCPLWMLHAMQNPCFKLLRVGHYRTAWTVVYTFNRQSVGFPTLQCANAVTEMFSNCFPAGQNHAKILAPISRKSIPA
jgi:hypothetical protein